jgi:outer membrane protein assembly factor BamB
MLRYLTVLLPATVVTLLASHLGAQSRDIGLVSSVQIGQVGLERIWFTHASVDSARGRIAHLTQYVNTTDKYTVFEVLWDGGRKTFSERDLGRAGVSQGKEAAEKVARRLVDDLNQQQQNAKLSVHEVPEITLYVMTDQGVVQSIDAETGRTRWTTAVGSARHPSEAVGANDKYVAAVNGSTLTVLEKDTGKVFWQQRVVGAPGAGPVLTDRYVFVPMIAGKIEGYDLEEPRDVPWIYQSHGRAMVQPVRTGDHIAWTTDQGHLNVAKGNDTAMQFRVESEKPIVSAAAYLPPNRILVASTDGYIYCIQEDRGSVVWRFSTGEPIIQSPVVIGNRVYVITVDGHLFAILADQGSEEWQVAAMRQLIASTSDRLYCVNDAGRLAILDLTNGAQLTSLNIGAVDVAYVNAQTDRLFIGTQNGQLQCLREAKQPWPLIHPGVIPAPKEAAPAAKKKKKAATEAAKPEKPASDNPFGVDMPAEPAAKPEAPGGDPFGGAPAEDPFNPQPKAPPAGEAPSDDPFKP